MPCIPDKYSEAIRTAPPGNKEIAIFYNNRAACYFKMAQYSSVISDCTEALRIDSDYSKCLLRRAQARRSSRLLSCSHHPSSHTTCKLLNFLSVFDRRVANCSRQRPYIRFQAYETDKKICEAYDDYQRVLKLDPSNRQAPATPSNALFVLLLAIV